MRARWLTGRAFLFHLILAVIVSVCLLAGWWQMHQALLGNSLSWAYTVEWPVFAVIAVIAWWHLIHEDPAERDERADRAARAAEREERVKTAGDAYDSDELPEAYAARVAAAARHELSSHLARLAEREAANTWRNLRAKP